MQHQDVREHLRPLKPINQHQIHGIQAKYFDHLTKLFSRFLFFLLVYYLSRIHSQNGKQMDHESRDVLELAELFIHVGVFVLDPLGSHDLGHCKYGLPRVVSDGGVDALEGQPIALELGLEVDLGFELGQTVQVQPFLEVINDKQIKLFKLVFLVNLNQAMNLLKCFLLLFL